MDLRFLENIEKIFYITLMDINKIIARFADMSKLSLAGIFAGVFCVIFALIYTLVNYAGKRD
jgi:hypothetical protein